ncbi:MAG: SPOR domain-containing protein [Magnetococcales bacterium]|nr:SPOR domain-containing protein [Magnetococcales bacterium]
MDSTSQREQQLFLIMGGVILALIIGVAIFDLFGKSGGSDFAFDEPRPVVKQPVAKPEESKKQDWVDAMAPAPVFQAAAGGAASGKMETAKKEASPSAHSPAAAANTASPPSAAVSSVVVPPLADEQESPPPAPVIPPAVVNVPSGKAAVSHAETVPGKVPPAARSTEPLPEETATGMALSGQDSLASWSPNAASLEAARHTAKIEKEEPAGNKVGVAALDKTGQSTAETAASTKRVNLPAMAEEAASEPEKHYPAREVSRALTSGLGQAANMALSSAAYRVEAPWQTPLLGLKRASRLSELPEAATQPVLNKPTYGGETASVATVQAMPEFNNRPAVAPQQVKPEYTEKAPVASVPVVAGYTGKAAAATVQAMPVQSFSHPLRALPVGSIAPVTAVPALPATAASPAEEEKEREYWVKLGTFSNEANALALSHSVAALMLDGQFLPVVRNSFTNENKPYYRVRVGPFAERSRAERVVQLVQHQVNITGTVVTAKK